MQPAYGCCFALVATVGAICSTDGSVLPGAVEGKEPGRFKVEQ